MKTTEGSRNIALRAALEEALELFAHEFCYADGRVVTDHITGEPMQAGGAWVEQARAALRSGPQSAIFINTIYEDAARICDEQAKDVAGEWHGPPEYRDGARKCADLIRARKHIIDD